MSTSTAGARRGSELTPAQVMASFDGPVGAYVHVPFCERICPFCPYNKVVAEEGLARRYFAALRQEVDGYVAARPEPFTSVYVGGARRPSTRTTSPTSWRGSRSRGSARWRCSRRTPPLNAWTGWRRRASPR